MSDITTDTTTTTRKPENFLAPISGEIPLLLLVPVYVIAIVLVIKLFKS